MARVREGFADVAVDALSVGVLIVAADGTIEGGNDAACAVFGVDDVSSRDIRDLIAARSRQAFEQAFGHVVSKDGLATRRQRLRVRIRSLDGTEVDVALRLSPREAGDETLVVVEMDPVDASHDLDPLRALHKRVVDLIASDAPFPVVIERTLEAVGEGMDWDVIMLWMLDPGTKRLVCAGAWCSSAPGPSHYMDASRPRSFDQNEGLVGTVWATGEPATSHDIVNDPFFDRTELAAHSDLHGFLMCPVTANGELIGVLELVSRRTQPPQREIRAIVEDLTGELGKVVQWSLRDEQLRLERSRLDLALEAGHMGIWHWHEPTNTVWWSEELERLYGLEPGGFDGTFEHYISLIHPDDRESVTSTIGNSMSAGETHYTLHRVLHPDRRTVWVEGIGRVIHQNGRPIGMTGVAADVTLRQHQQEMLAAVFVERDATARVLQQSLLPPHLPEIPGVELAAVYEPGTELVGGDFYDLFPVGEDTWVVVIGDVMGKGVEAAAVTALVRYSVRAAASVRRRPCDILATVNDVLNRDMHTDRFCSALIARIDVAGGGIDLEVSSAGHPEVVIARADGTVEAVPCKGHLLGVFAAAEFDSASIRVESSDVAVMYTDGITDARRNNELFGTEGVLAVMREAHLEPRACVDRLVRHVVAYRNDETRDDAAVIAIAPETRSAQTPLL